MGSEEPISQSTGAPLSLNSSHTTAKHGKHHWCDNDDCRYAATGNRHMIYYMPMCAAKQAEDFDGYFSMMWTRIWFAPLSTIYDLLETYNAKVCAAERRCQVPGCYKSIKYSFFCQLVRPKLTSSVHSLNIKAVDRIQNCHQQTELVPELLSHALVLRT